MLSAMTPVACITGATSGIGRAYAIALGHQGFDLIVTGRRKEKLRELSQDIRRADPQRQVSIVVSDLTEVDAVRNLAQLVGTTPGLAMLVHNAGYGHRTQFFDTGYSDLRDMAVLHMEAAATLVRAAVPAITETVRSGVVAANPRHRLPAAVILVSSLAAFTPMPGAAMYTSTKAYLIELGRAIQPELVTRGITTQVLCPGFTHTDFHDRLDWSAERRRSRGLVRWMAADEVVTRSLRRLRRASPRKSPVYIPGTTNRLLRGLVRLIPHRIYLRIASSVSG